ncbi:DUF551 domain-containing protein [Rhizobium sp. YIM 134829]|uniref:DUF551 domain-containing protein n=1 Tax=Rhizobium sp. YIM 134829 TaxID=3390453 RepID=UPI00397A6C79
MSAVTDEMVDRMIAAVEGEVDGLAIDAEQATAILAYVLEGALLPAHPEPDAGRVEGWQPIETAPKDGTKILCICMRTDEAVKHRLGIIAVDRWTKQYDGWANFNERFWPATHWMPLPLPPQIEQEDENQ